METLLKPWTDRLQPYAWNLIVLVSAILIGLLIKVIIKYSLKLYKEQHAEYSLLNSIIEHMAPPLNHFAPLFVLNVMLPLFEFSRSFYNLFSHAVQIAIIISFAVLMMSSLNIFEDYVLHTYDLKKSDNLKERKIRTQLQFIRRIVITLIICVTVAIILLSFDNVRKIGAGLLTGVGVGGIIIGFAAQKSLSNLLAGFQIAFTQPIRIDDVLVVENEWGRVEEITLTYVVLNIWDERRLILPINYFIEKPFQNWTRTSAQILGTVFLYMDYTVPVDEIRKEFDRLLDATKLWDKRVKVIQVTDAKEHTVEVRALVSAADSGLAFDLRCYIRENLIKFISTNYPGSLPVNRVSLDRAEQKPPDTKRPSKHV